MKFSYIRKKKRIHIAWTPAFFQLITTFFSCCWFLFLIYQIVDYKVKYLVCQKTEEEEKKRKEFQHKTGFSKKKKKIPHPFPREREPKNKNKKKERKKI